MTLQFAARQVDSIAPNDCDKASLHTRPYQLFRVIAAALSAHCSEVWLHECGRIHIASGRRRGRGGGGRSCSRTSGHEAASSARHCATRAATAGAETEPLNPVCPGQVSLPNASRVQGQFVSAAPLGTHRAVLCLAAAPVTPPAAGEGRGGCPSVALWVRARRPPANSNTASHQQRPHLRAVI